LKKDLASNFRNNGLSALVLHRPLGEVQCNSLIRPTSVKIGGGGKSFVPFMI